VTAWHVLLMRALPATATGRPPLCVCPLSQDAFRYLQSCFELLQQQPQGGGAGQPGRGQGPWAQAQPRVEFRVEEDSVRGIRADEPEAAGGQCPVPAHSMEAAVPAPGQGSPSSPSRMASQGFSQACLPAIQLLSSDVAGLIRGQYGPACRVLLHPGRAGALGKLSTQGRGVPACSCGPTIRVAAVLALAVFVQRAPRGAQERQALPGGGGGAKVCGGTLRVQRASASCGSVPARRSSAWGLPA